MKTTSLERFTKQTQLVKYRKAITLLNETGRSHVGVRTLDNSGFQDQAFVDNYNDDMFSLDSIETLFYLPLTYEQSVLYSLSGYSVLSREEIERTIGELEQNHGE